MRRKRFAAVLLTALLTLSAAKPHVKQVYDGDTLLLSTGEHVRYIGVDAPEIDHQGGKSDFLANEARRLNAALVQGKPVRLELDSLQSSWGKELRDYLGWREPFLLYR